MNSSLLCIGSELLSGFVVNSNAVYLAKNLSEIGLTLNEICTISDDKAEIKSALSRLLNENDLVLITGGLGPTDDDLTREAVSETIRIPLILDNQWLEKLETRFVKRGYKMPASNKKQAYILEGSTVIDNPLGTAPGLLLNHENTMIIMLPGPPDELQQMFNKSVVPVLKELTPEHIVVFRTLKCIGLGESMLEEKIKMQGNWNFEPISFIAKDYEIDLQLKASGRPDLANRLLDEAEIQLRQLLGESIFAVNDQTLSESVAILLIENNSTIAVAESCSGGQLCDVITNIPGSSKYFLGGIVAYSKEAKVNLLGIDPQLLNGKGVVSEAAARAMAEAARSVFTTTYGIGITGVAGPESDSSNLPIGLVFIAVADKDRFRCKKTLLTGSRIKIKQRIAQLALSLLRELLLEK